MNKPFIAIPLLFILFLLASGTNAEVKMKDPFNPTTSVSSVTTAEKSVPKSDSEKSEEFFHSLMGPDNNIRFEDMQLETVPSIESAFIDSNYDYDKGVSVEAGAIYENYEFTKENPIETATTEDQSSFFNAKDTEIEQFQMENPSVEAIPFDK
jgi:hypothetical protein